ncbi:DUF373 family protein [Candidatus Micrarchaeota archaeon]|nr:DUF373 family protein [Candidatus Micrarchaeota archaeon]
MVSPLLVLCIDRDNDIYEKAGVSGPIIGRDANLTAATKLALADPQDVDANALFYAVKTYDQIKKTKKNLEIATLTGHKSLGYKADREISVQLDRLVKETGAVSCILVTDGAADEEIIPIIKSRIKIDSSKIVYVKQAKELERTYFVILEKLKDPYYARIILGIPALLVLLFSAFSYLGYGWQPVGIIAGAYLMVKGFGIDEILGDFVKDINFSFERSSWIANVSSFLLVIIAFIVGYYSYERALDLSLSTEKIVAYMLKPVVSILLLSGLLTLIGKSMDALSERKNFKITTYSLYGIAFVLISLVLRVGSDWILNLEPPYVSFGDFLFVIVVSIMAAALSLKVVKFLRTNSLLSMKMEGKEVINDYGSFIGRVVGVDGKNGMIIIQNIFDKRLMISFDTVSSVGEQIVIKANV